MPLPRDVVAEVRRLDEAQLRQLLILARGLLLDSEVPVVEISDIPGMPAVRYRQRTVSCGKASCTGCPHGPYWYAHWTEDGRKRSQYIGSELPAAVRRKLEELDARRADVGAAVTGSGGHPARHRRASGEEGPRLAGRRGLHLVDDRSGRH